MPTYLKTERGLSVVGTGGYLTFLISGAFIGYLTGGYLTDRLGRKRNIRLFAVLSALCILAYANIPERRQHPSPGARFPARVLHVGDLQRLRLLS